MSKKESASKVTKEEPKTLEEMILNYPEGKYSAIPLAALWAKVLRKREEHRHMTSNEILDIALREVLSGSVTWKDVKKHLSANGAEAAEALNGEEKAI